MARSFAALRLSWLVTIARDRDRRITDFTVRVAAVLSDYLNEKNGAWPSLETLARVLEASTEGVRIALVKLEGCGYLTAERARGRGKTNVYRMVVPSDEKPQQPLVPSVGENPKGHRVMTPTAVGKKPQQPLAQNLKKGTERREPGASLPTRAGFESFWKAYPRKEGVGAARRQFEIALAKPGVTVEVILESVARYAAWAEEKALKEETQQYARTPARWLADEHWEDELPELDLSRHFPSKEWFEQRDAEKLRVPFTTMAAPLIEDDDS